ncbi:MAG: radical SAM protein [Planctomycetota bacterium]
MTKDGVEPEFRDALAGGTPHRRGAGLNPGNRFEANRVHVSGDAIDADRDEREADAAEAQRAGPSDKRSATAPRKHSKGEGKLPGQHPGGAVALQVFADKTRTIINRVKPTSDVPFDWTVNPYRGCEHGCIYCFARPYHEYLGFSMGLDFETKIVAKHDAPDILKRELASKHWPGEPIVMSAITDIYQPLEKELKIARGCLEVMASCFQPVSTMTKNTLVLRDLDLWQRLGEVNAGRVTVTLVTLDDELATRLEPRASPPTARLRVIRKLTEAGVPVSVNIAPVIPGLTDHELPRLLEAVADAGARRVAWVLLRLPYQLKDLFLDWLQRNVHPDRARHVESLIRQARGGKLYDSGPMAERVKLDDATSKMVANPPRNLAAAGRDALEVEVTRDSAGTLGTTSRRDPAFNQAHDQRGGDPRGAPFRGGTPGSSAEPAPGGGLGDPGGGRGGAGGHDRRRGTGVHVEHLKRMFDVYCRKYGLNRDVRPIARKHFRRPRLDGQMGLFGG